MVSAFDSPQAGQVIVDSRIMSAMVVTVSRGAWYVKKGRSSMSFVYAKKMSADLDAAFLDRHRWLS